MPWWPGYSFSQGTAGARVARVQVLSGAVGARVALKTDSCYS